MATVADELLNDFESDAEDENQESLEGDIMTHSILRPSDPSDAHGEGGMELDGDEEEPDDEEGDEAAPNGKIQETETEEEARARVEKMDLGAVGDVRSVANLMKTLQPVLEKIAHYQNLPSDQQTKNIGSIEDNPEYKLLTESNTLSTSIDGEVILVHKFIRDHYSTRFPELERLVQNPLDYAKTVAIIGNGPMEDVKSLSNSTDNPVGQSLRQVLDGPTMMVVTVEATTTRGVPLSDSELANVRRACDMILQLDKAKRTLTDYVQSRMNVFAPNLTVLIGSLTAAQLINFAGGIAGLAKTPSCNIPPLGSKKQTQTGFATNVGVRHQGFLYNSPLVREVPSDLKKQAMRIVSAKVVLAARMDRVHASPNGADGELLKEQCINRLDKLVEPAPNRGARALPAPDDKPSRKRGGRRARKAKEATAMTDLRKAQNRMAFGKEEAEIGYGTGDGTTGLGMIGAAQTGSIRTQQIDQRTRAKLSKKNPGWGGATPAPSGLASTFHGGFGSGTASVLRNSGLRTSGVGMGSGTSSIAFTPVQGLELVDPKVRDEMNRKRKADEDRWFKGGTFTQIGGSASSAPGAGASNGGFKVPALPPPGKKRDTGATK
ncbi:Nop domain-containing protein [Aureobasidium pullulans EXF-150]|uniref:Nop domain-containing protein n=1 Tax=Aureobasidium pullulans EXF-150 TaxID=1043002 RepID=A0A074X7L4_AURPU|nr:Nop domain-containing protein [Aureobasidium pullulans EXF-150]KEQ79739.1 Nop domain-containing protein [Aureobasidium pullulans EXF-150]